MSEANPLTTNASAASSDTHQDGSHSQWQLIRLRFARHRMAHFSLYVILALYGMAIFAEFFAPTTKEWRSVDHIYCPPQRPAFSLKHGLHVVAMQKQKDPITFRRYFTKYPDQIVPLGFFVKGEPYKLWGLIPMDLHFFGIKRSPPSNEQTSTADGKVKETVETFYLLGADKFGQDILSRIIFGSRISLSIGIASILATFLLGILIGGVSGYLGGRIDNLIQRSIEIINSFPQIPLWLVLGALVPSEWSPLRTYFAITIVLSLLNWTGLARVVRGKLLSLREEDYAIAARLIGAGHSRVIFRHLVPGFTSHIIVSLTLSVPAMILGETALSFLSLGLRPPVVSWGVMLQDCMKFQVLGDHPWVLMPVLFIVIIVLAFNFLGDGLRDAADPYSAQ
jgi:peptide/nickel transport system permease protein